MGAFLRKSLFKLLVGRVVHDLAVFLDGLVSVGSHVGLEGLKDLSDGDSSLGGSLPIIGRWGGSGLGDGLGLLDSLDGVWVESSVLGGVSQGVLSLSQVDSDVLSGGSENSLDLVGVDDSGDVGVGQDFLLDSVASLELGGLSEGPEVLVQGLKGRLGPDDEPSCFPLNKAYCGH